MKGDVCALEAEGGFVNVWGFLYWSLGLGDTLGPILSLGFYINEGKTL